MITFRQLRKRKLVQWAATYAAASWLLLQVLALFGAQFDWSPALLRGITIAVAVGFFATLVLAWYHGELGRQRVSPRELLLLVGLLAIGAWLLWRNANGPPPAAMPVAATPAPARSIPARSIAVLPFVDMSAGKDQGYFSEGMSEELLNLLAKVPELHVAARTSSFSFKDKNLEIGEVARRLGVAHVLEGSVRKSGQTLRVSAQLIRADNGYQLWSQTYDRHLDDVFAIQNEIAADVVRHLEVRLPGAAPTARETDPAAFAMYLQAVQLGRRFTIEGFERSDELLRKVLAVDPRYAPAWNVLSRNAADESSISMISNAEGTRVSIEMAERALTIDPDYAPARAMLGRHLVLRRDFAGAALHLQRALALDPGNLDVLLSTSFLLRGLGRLEEMVGVRKYVSDRDPVNVSSLSRLGSAYIYAGRYDDVLATMATVLNLDPQTGRGHYTIGMARLLRHEPALALAEMQAESSETWRLVGLPMAYHALGRKAESDAALAVVVAKLEKESAFNIAGIHAFRGDPDRAFEWLEKAARYDDPGLIEILVDPLFGNLHEDPRWLPFLRRQGMAPEQLAKIEFTVALPE